MIIVFLKVFFFIFEIQTSVDEFQWKCRDLSGQKTLPHCTDTLFNPSCPMEDSEGVVLTLTGVTEHLFPAPW